MILNALYMLNRFHKDIVGAMNDFDKQSKIDQYRFRGFISYILNNYIQVFIDLMDIVLIYNGKASAGTSFQRYCREYDTVFKNKTESEKEILKYLVVYNAAQDHRDYDFVTSEDFFEFSNYIDGLSDIMYNFFEYFNEKGMLGIILA